MDDGGLLRHLHDGGFNKHLSLVGKPVPTVNDLTSLLFNHFKGGDHVADRAQVDEWTHQYPLFKGISNRHLSIGIDQTIGEFPGDLLLQKNTSSGGASLARSPDGPKKRRTNRHIQIRFVIHNNRVVAA